MKQTVLEAFPELVEVVAHLHAVQEKVRRARQAPLRLPSPRGACSRCHHISHYGECGVVTQRDNDPTTDEHRVLARCACPGLDRNEAQFI